MQAEGQSEIKNDVPCVYEAKLDTDEDPEQRKKKSKDSSDGERQGEICRPAGGQHGNRRHSAHGSRSPSVGISHGGGWVHPGSQLFASLLGWTSDARSEIRSRRCICALASM